MMTKKEKLDPENNNQVENTGDEPLKVEETTQTPKEQDQAEEALEEGSSGEMVEINQDPPSEIVEVQKEPLEEKSIDVAEATSEEEASQMDVEPPLETPSNPQDSIEIQQPEVEDSIAPNSDFQEPEAIVEEVVSGEVEVPEDPSQVIEVEVTDVQLDPVNQEPEPVKPEVEDTAQVEIKEEEVLKPESPIETKSEEKVLEQEPEKKVKKTVQGEKASKGKKTTEASKEEIFEEKPAEDNQHSKKAAYTETLETDEDYTQKYSPLSREELVEAIETLVQNEDVGFIRKHIGFIKVAYHKLTRSEKEKLIEQLAETAEELEDGSDTHKENQTESEAQTEAQAEAQAEAERMDPLKIRFDGAFKVYKQKKAQFDQSQENQKQENLVAKEAILEELRNLIESEEELKKTYDQFRDLQERWRMLGQVPQLSKNNLWNNYHFLIEKFFDKVKINQELKDLDLRKNLELKTELCEKAEELLLETSVVNSFQKLQKLHETWKETGPVPNDKKDEIWERFRATTVTLNQRREEHYGGLREDQDKNYSAKLVLCEKAEQIAELVADNPRKWQEQTNEINELFKVLKTIGFAPKKVNNEIWNRFRTALSNFFKNKKDYLGGFKDVQTDNYNQKVNLCIQAEALKNSADWGKATNEFISLQKQWKTIGQVPPKYSEKIWKRFRAACDEFFNRKSEFFANIDQSHEDNLKQKKELIEKIANHKYSQDNTENLKVLNEFQRQWMEIGHVPIKQKDKVYLEFRKAVDDKFESLGISRKAKTAMSFRNKMENIKANPNADNIIYKERTFLQNKISQLQNDINLWENNIGFFASSKKADVLKKEFEEKIEKAKQDITIMEEKLKIMREQ